MLTGVLLRVVAASGDVDAPCNRAGERPFAAHKVQNGRLIALVRDVHDGTAVQRAQIAGLPAAGGIERRVGQRHAVQVLLLRHGLTAQHLGGKPGTFGMGMVQCNHIGNLDVLYF